MVIVSSNVIVNCREFLSRARLDNHSLCLRLKIKLPYLTIAAILFILLRYPSVRFPVRTPRVCRELNQHPTSPVTPSQSTVY